MLKLPNVSLVLTDTKHHELTRLSAEESMKNIEFGDVLVFSDSEKTCPAGARFIQCAPITAVEKINGFLWYEVPAWVKTSHVLWAHWDSWVIAVHNWTDDFLKCDYIGAPWWYKDGYNVGNGGFSLRTMRLMRHLVSHRDEYPVGHPEDNKLCRSYRAFLEPTFKWASEELAYKFSFECVINFKATPFGYHCLRNWPLVLEKQKFYERLEIGGPEVSESSDGQYALKLAKVLGDNCGVIAKGGYAYLKS